MSEFANTSPRSSIESSVEDLLRLRPDKHISGFAPGGKVSTEQFGLNRSVFRGRGMEFDESRIYQPGDDIRSIDWRVTARTGKVHSKLFQEEKQRNVFILLDCRSMMHFGSQVRFKSVTAAHIASILSWVAIDGGDCIGGCVIDQTKTHHFSATRNYSSMLRFLKCMSDATYTRNSQSENESGLYQSVRQLRRHAVYGALVFIISDFHDFSDDLEREMLMLSQHTNLTNIMVHDQLDRLLPTNDDFRISDGNKALSLRNLSKTNLDNYRNAFESRNCKLKSLARRKHIGFMSMPTNAEPKLVLLNHADKSSLKSQFRKAA